MTVPISIPPARKKIKPWHIALGVVVFLCAGCGVLGAITDNHGKADNVAALSSPQPEVTTTPATDAEAALAPVGTTSAADPAPSSTVGVAPPPTTTVAAPATTKAAPPTTTKAAPPTTTKAVPPTTTTAAGNCTAGYSPCLVDHGGADYDCAGGSGNGPYYTAPGVTYRVTGSDPYGLDNDNDGYGCD